jgi:hypothetical protein
VNALGLALGLPFVRSSGAAPLSPLSVANLRVWLDAADSATQWQTTGFATPAAADLDPVLGFQDKSGQNNHVTQASGPSAPLVDLSTVPGKRYLSFPSSLISRATLTGGVIAQPFTVYMVAAFGTVSRIVHDGQAAGFCRIAWGISGTQMTLFLGSTLTATSTPDWSAGPVVVCCTADATDRIYVNDPVTAEMSNPAGTQGYGGIALGGLNNGTAPNEGMLFGELAVYAGAHDQATRELLMNTFFKPKWGIP